MRKRKIWQSLVSAMLTVAMVSTAVIPAKAVGNEKESIEAVKSRGFPNGKREMQ